MRPTLVLTLVLVLVASPTFAEEVGSQWNDSDTIQLPGGPDTYPGITTTPDPELGATPAPGSAPSTGDQPSGDIIIFTASGSQLVPASSPLGSGSGGVVPQSIVGSASGGDDPEPLLNLLLTSGALTGSGAGAASGGIGASPTGASGYSGSELDLEDGVYIDGSKVRAALKGRGVLRVSLRTYSTSRNALSTSDLGLIGASAMLRNPALESAFISLSRFDISYRSRGYLLAVFPISFRVRLSVNPVATTLSERVRVTLPWYSFFLRTFVAKEALARDIDSIVTRDIDPSLDRSQVQAQLFNDVSIMLQGRVDTVEESVELH